MKGATMLFALGLTAAIAGCETDPEKQRQAQEAHERAEQYCTAQGFGGGVEWEACMSEQLSRTQ